MRGIWIASVGLLVSGCSLLPDVRHKPQFHNPFPQLQRVAVLPFYNQSDDPHVDGDAIALAYYNELQLIPGFEVMPVNVVKQVLEATKYEPRSGEDFQRLAAALGVDAVLAGSVTDYSPYYPPRITLAVNWYAANPGFHPIPPGYGLPWGTSQEEYIPDSLVHEAEFALAREQLKTQTPLPPAKPLRLGQPTAARASANKAATPRVAEEASDEVVSTAAPLPADWPDPNGLVPRPPSPERPVAAPQHAPIITHTRTYNGHDEDFTTALENYYYFRDEARFGGWQGYLQRSEDFVRFCCHLHLTESLAARGGAGTTRVVFRWPIGRYER